MARPKKTLTPEDKQKLHDFVTRFRDEIMSPDQRQQIDDLANGPGGPEAAAEFFWRTADAWSVKEELAWRKEKASRERLEKLRVDTLDALTRYCRERPDASYDAIVATVAQEFGVAPDVVKERLGLSPKRKKTILTPDQERCLREMLASHLGPDLARKIDLADLKRKTFDDGTRAFDVPGKDNAWMAVPPEGGWPLLPLPEIAVDILRTPWAKGALEKALPPDMREAIADLIERAYYPVKKRPGRQKLTEEQRLAQVCEWVRRKGLVEDMVRAGKPYRLAIKRVAKDEGISESSFKRSLPKRDLFADPPF
jgi:hypothetical protein